MGKTDLYPMTFHPIYKHYLWGGKNLRSMGKAVADDETVAESWEISDHGDDLSVVRNGFLKGKTLRELIARWGEDISPRTATGRFPILIKYIDANRRLSVQVHPDDSYARTHEGPQELGKTECWYVLDAPPGAELVVGMGKGITKQVFQRMIAEDRIADGLHTIPVSKGDFVYIKSGTVHAILEGILICEIQENSDSTYRLYDWGRVGDDGKPRPLHIDKALDVITFVPENRYDRFMESIVIPYDRKASNHTHELVRGTYFNIDLLTYDHDIELSVGHCPMGHSPVGQCHFNTLSILDGEGTLVWPEGELPLHRGETILVPRPVSEYRLNTRGITALRTFL
jgi:mannose-6-phosphate isomerase